MTRRRRHSPYDATRVATTTTTDELDPLDFLGDRRPPRRRGAGDPRHGAPVRARADRARTSASGSSRAILPRELIEELAKLGLFGMHLEGYGLPGRELRRVRARRASSSRRATPASAALVSVQGSLAMFAIWRWGSEEQKQRWLPPMHEGEAIGCFGLTEPDAGSDPGSMRTTRAARRLRLDPQRREDVDHERHDRRRRDRLGAHRRRRDPRLPRREGHARLRGAGDQAEALAARVGHVRARAQGRARARGEPLPGGRRRCAGRCRA